MKRFSAVLVSTVVGLGSVVMEAGAQDLPEGVTDEMIEQGRSIFIGAGICVACHGMDAKGTVGPDLTDDEWLIGEGTYEQIVERVTTGVGADEITNTMGAIMPPKGGSAITEEQVRQVSAYVWSLRRR